MSLNCPACADPEHVLGHEVRGVFDGVLFWSCESCGHAWPRKHGHQFRDRLAHSHVDAFNRRAHNPA